MSYTGKHCTKCGDPTFSESDLCYMHIPLVNKSRSIGPTSTIGTVISDQDVLEGFEYFKSNPGQQIDFKAVKPGDMPKFIIVEDDGKVDIEQIQAIIASHPFHGKTLTVISQENINALDKALSYKEEKPLEELLYGKNKTLLEEADKLQEKIYFKHEEGEYGYCKNRKGSNKKYIKRKKARNGKTKKRKK